MSQLTTIADLVKNKTKPLIKLSSSSAVSFSSSTSSSSSLSTLSSSLSSSVIPTTTSFSETSCVPISAPKIYLNFNDLANSQYLQDQLIHIFVTTLLKHVCGHSEGNIIINKDNETDSNHQFIKDNWNFIACNFNMPTRIFSTQKLVRQTIKYLIIALNQKYNFQTPPTYESTGDTKRVGKSTITKCYALVYF